MRWGSPGTSVALRWGDRDQTVLEVIKVNVNRVLRWLAASAIADGLGLLIGGRAYARVWELIPGPRLYRRSIAWFLGLPSPVLRLIGISEAASGVALLSRVPIPVPELYRAVAPLYDAASPLWRRWLYADADRALDRALTEQLAPNGRVLDLGCGTGANLGRLLDLGLPFGSYLGVDGSEEMLATARARFAHLEKASFQHLDLTADPLPGGPFDLVVSTWVFSHLPDPRLVLEKAMGVLGPEGQMVLLFLAESESWQARLIRPVLDAMSARPVPRETYLAFPSLALEGFAGGSVVVMALKKEA